MPLLLPPVSCPCSVKGSFKSFEDESAKLDMDLGSITVEDLRYGLGCLVTYDGPSSAASLPQPKPFSQSPHHSHTSLKFAIIPKLCLALQPVLIRTWPPCARQGSVIIFTGWRRWWWCPPSAVLVWAGPSWRHAGHLPGHTAQAAGPGGQGGAGGRVRTARRWAQRVRRQAGSTIS